MGEQWTGRCAIRVNEAEQDDTATKLGKLKPVISAVQQGKVWRRFYDGEGRVIGDRQCARACRNHCCTSCAGALMHPAADKSGEHDTTDNSGAVAAAHSVPVTVPEASLIEQNIMRTRRSVGGLREVDREQRIELHTPVRPDIDKTQHVTRRVVDAADA